MLFDIDKVFWKYGTFSRLFHWLKRDYDTLLGGLPERSLLLRQLKTQQVHTDLLMAQPRMLNVVDSFPIELIFPIRQGRSKAQLGTKSRDKGRWSVGIKVAWILNTFLDYLADCNEIMLTDWGFRCADGLPQNVKVCKKGTWTDRMAVEAAFSMLTVICKAKKIR